MRTPFLLPACSASARRRCAGSASGFTLIELMVAMTGGLFLSMVVFALARDSMRFYAREGRVGNATLSNVTGFERLSNDVARAGHLATPNIQQDPHVCNLPQADWPSMLRTLRAIVIEPPNSTQLSTTELAGAANTAPQPQGIVIAGALNTPEELYTAQVGPTGAGGWQVYINLNTPSAARVGLSPASTATATNLAAMQSIFMAGSSGRIIRLRWSGMDQYAVAASVATSTGQAYVTLAAAPALQTLKVGGGQCGVDSLGTGMSLSVIDLVRYNIRPMVTDPNYAALYQASGLSSGGGSSIPFEAGRAELVRVELDPNGQEIASTRELVSEYAVDLQFSGWGATAALNPAVVAVGSPAINATYNSTQLLRGLHVRFSTRSREADRDTQISTGSGGGSSDMYRFPLTDPVSGATRYARVRTLQSDISLRNLENSNW